ncbi:hypothetical protein GCM10020358_52990 [Amorphoplanes nipponensis]|uniref:DUF3040 domain-containing protein n=1 Tax=Actinoplanes nipponensis TaxID=135950 RepID=A0A919JHZ6_9ACTN|nr:DUF3040 domain-containing protein [Actinoplanes nipponensis]GIE49561.1 hypothetical protein Ani05nite_30950 [Actinoplanes nipponensis]
MRDPAFEAIVARLCADDPEFARRMSEPGGPPSKKRMVLAVLLWTIAPVCVFLGGATGVLMAVVAVAYAAYLRWSGSLFVAAGSRTTLPRRRRPGASL